MRRRTALVLSALAATALGAQPSPGQQTPEARPIEARPIEARPGEAQPPGLEVMYVCPSGTDFSAVFSRDGELATLSVPGQPEVELPRQRSGSGFIYSDSYYELRGRGREATLTAAGRSMRCHAAGRPGEPPRTYEGGGLTITLFPDGTFRLRELRSGPSPQVQEPVLDLGQWAQEVDGGVRLVLRGGVVARRAFREAAGDRLVAENGNELSRAAQPDQIDGNFHLAGLYRDTQSGGLFAECLTGRTFEVAPKGAEPDLERAWTQATPSREAQLYVEIVGRFVDGAIEADQLLNLKRDGACPRLAPRGAALRGTEWRVLEIDGERPTFEGGRQQPRIRLDDEGKYTASTGCNTLGGNYQLDANGVRFLPAATTLIGCPPPAADVERRFLAALGAVRLAQIAGTTLDLMDESGKRRLRLDARGR